MVYIHIIKAICHRYQHYAQISVCMFIDAMETPPNKVKIPFFVFFFFFAVSEASNYNFNTAPCKDQHQTSVITWASEVSS